MQSINVNCSLCTDLEVTQSGFEVIKLVPLSTQLGMKFRIHALKTKSGKIKMYLLLKHSACSDGKFLFLINAKTAIEHL